MSESWERTDDVVTIRPPQQGDSERLVAGRDAEFHRFLGAGSDKADPVACIVVDGDVVGWVDHDAERSWLLPSEVNVGYNVFAAHRGCGIASRAVQLLMHHFAVTEQCRTATLLIDPANVRSQALAERCEFERQADLDDNPYYKRTVPPLTYRRGDVTMRRAHALERGSGVSDSFGAGPRWTFAIDLADATSVGGVDVNLASDHAPPGEANLSYWVHPESRRRRIAPDAVRAALQLLRDHTGTRRAHIMVDPENTASLAVAASVDATAEATTADRHGRTLVRHSMEL